jgi:hypothetical protein
MNVIPLSECKQGVVYRLLSRNLVSGVFDGKTGFIGIREKFGVRFLSTEYHWDTGPPYGTARPLGAIGEIDPSIPLEECLGSVDSNTGRPVAFDRPIENGGRGWYFLDTGEGSEEIGPVSVNNKALYELMEDWTTGVS